ncbi:putative signaling protein [Caenibius tardaugens NBRC 16725]|uniref:diguanylate cyclase n=1 Tax=Caenibius tardaugens NBRC 16725 TaxID=1219035 RepID=U2YQD0_9SPHN|nr:GGDEF domain-containing protein [Caenibius tardaugens]AZI36344.1 GGDEF domain-containing protein [Caenibius tardaugens NBRC 16725]GAD50857.1 putative signaling protein [Caenibius tardaugens NBRC 16725]
MMLSFAMRRRAASTPASWIRRPAFFQIPPQVTAFALGLTVLVIQLTDHFLRTGIWFGPVYLLAIAIAALLVNTSFAIGLGLTILLCNAWAQNQYISWQRLLTPELDFVVRFSSVMIIILMLGLARKAFENEWNRARIDSLTGALNRQAFFELARVVSRRCEPAVLIYADLDGLKCINDALGHESGDESLRGFADRVRGAIRKNDIFARIGGDEFVILLRVKNAASARIAANRLDSALNHARSNDQMSCSMGVLFLPNGVHMIDAELKKADVLMYTAKNKHIGFVMASLPTSDQTESCPYAIDSTIPLVDRKVPFRSQERRDQSGSHTD